MTHFKLMIIQSNFKIYSLYFQTQYTAIHKRRCEQKKGLKILTLKYLPWNLPTFVLNSTIPSNCQAYHKATPIVLLEQKSL